MKAIIFLLTLTVSCLAAPRHSHDQLADDDGFGIIRIYRPRPVVIVDPFVARPTFGIRHPISSEEDSGEGGFFPSSFFPSFFPNPFSIFREIIKDIPLPDNNNTQVVNSTSDTKIIDGHKVVVNDTVYKNPDSGAILRVHSIHVVDDSEEETSATTRSPNAEDLTTPEPSSTPEIRRDSAENEVGGVKEREKIAEHSADDKLTA